jgi:hypothetical protein
MKIGVLAPYLDTRSDIREMLDLLRREHEIVVYVRAPELQKMSQFLHDDITMVPIPTFHGIQKILVWFWQYLYLMLGKIPASRYNYYMAEHIKLHNPAIKKWQKTIQYVSVQCSKILPRIIHYDHYLFGLTRLKAPSRIQANIEVFLCFTEIYHDWFCAQILAQKKPVWTYVYSWDHPCKMKTFSKRCHYLVWHEGIKTDLIKLQNLSPNRIHVWGSTQFAYVHDYLQSTCHQPSPFDFQYIYLGCATGYDALTRQEVEYCKQIAEEMQRVVPEWKLVIRPYPFQKNSIVYDKLMSLVNVIFDINEEKSKHSLKHKYLQIQHAEAFFHFGTTLGYEAGYFKTPSFLIDFVNPEKDHLLYGFVHQYQNNRYLNNDEEYNVIKTKNNLRKILLNLSDKTCGIRYTNKKISQDMPLESFEGLANKFISLITTCK